VPFKVAFHRPNGRRSGYGRRVVVLLVGVALLVLPAGWLLISSACPSWGPYCGAEAAPVQGTGEHAKDKVLRRKRAKADRREPRPPTAPTCLDPSIGFRRGRILIGTSSWTDPTLVRKELSIRRTTSAERG